MNCDYLVKNNNCKFKSKYIYRDKNYCTRHYNIMQKQNNIVNENIDKELLNILENNKIKYTEIKYLDKGTFNKVYLIINNDIKFIIKYQNLKNKKNLLYYEYLLLYNSSYIILYKLL